MVGKAKAKRLKSAASKPVNPGDSIYGAAAGFVRAMSFLAHEAQASRPENDHFLGWKAAAGPFAHAYLLGRDLRKLVHNNPDVVAKARSAYPAGSPSIRIGKLPPCATVIETLEQGAFQALHNALYPGQDDPIPVDSSMTWTKAWQRVCDDWNQQDREWGGSRLRLFRCENIDFDDLTVQLDREARAVLGMICAPPSVDQEVRRKLSGPVQTAVWEFLDGKRLKGSELVDQLSRELGGVFSEESVRNAVFRIRDKVGADLIRRDRDGYWRPDAPPA